MNKALKALGIILSVLGAVIALIFSYIVYEVVAVDGKSANIPRVTLVYTISAIIIALGIFIIKRSGKKKD